MLLLFKIYGAKAPFPQYAPSDNPLKIAEWLQDAVKKHGACRLNAAISKVIRICVVATKHNIDLTGVTFVTAGEPTSDDKVEAVQQTGAKVIPFYGFTEMGAVAMACTHRKRASHYHLMKNSVALIQYPVDVFDQTVQALCFTSLLATNPKMLLNAQFDDYGTVERYDCGCPLYQLGWDDHLLDIYSYSKLTTDGTTLIGSDMIHILERVLPERFGGSLVDYQLVEEEDESGRTKIALYVDPSITVCDDNILREGFLSALNESAVAAQLAQKEFRDGDSIIIRRQKPLLTSHDKHFPIRTLRKTDSKSD